MPYKDTSLLCYEINYDRKKFYDIVFHFCLLDATIMKFNFKAAFTLAIVAIEKVCVAQSC